MSAGVTVWLVTCGMFLLALCIESWFSWRFLRRLKHEFPRLWEISGRRTIWTDGDLISAWPTIRFLWRREYLATGTQEEIAFCESYRLPVILSWAAAGITFAAMLGGYVMLDIGAQLEQIQ
jgi:hypothetical protein